MHSPCMPSGDANSSSNDLMMAQDQTIDSERPHLPVQQPQYVSVAAGKDVVHVPDDAAQGCLELQALLRSPVTRLPPEILAYIFRCYVDGQILVGKTAHAPFHLAHVCKLWGVIAESEPRIWTSIHLYIPESRQNRSDDLSRIKPIFDLYLKRSGALPVSFTFIDYRIYHPDTNDLVSFLADRLRAHACRWKRLSFHLHCRYFHILSTFTPCDLSSLEHIHISGDPSPPRPSATLRLNLESATKLTSFSYDRSHLSADERIQLRWENLLEVSSEFTLHHERSFTLIRQLDQLALCHNITICSIGIDAPLRPRPGSITLPRLETLRVRRLSPQSIAHNTIDRLILPQLRTLEVDASYLVTWNRRWHERTFSNLLVRSGCSLLHLSIKDVDFPNDELLRCLALSHSLVSLCFIPCPRSQDIVDVIRKLDVSRTLAGDSRQSGGPFVPQLREVTLASSVESNLDLMMASLRSRRGASASAAGVSALRLVKITFFDMWHDTGADRIRTPEVRLGRLRNFREEVEFWVSSSSEDEDGCGKKNEEDGFRASVVIDAPYFPEYVEVNVEH